MFKSQISKSLNDVHCIDAQLGCNEGLGVLAQVWAAVDAVIFLEMGKAHVDAAFCLNTPVGRENPGVAVEDAGAECLVAETPGDWVRTIGSCRAVVSVNTGPMHVADALGVPLVVVDGPSRLPLWAPEGEKSVVLHRQDAVPWVPVHFGDDYALQAQVMALVTPNAVLDALRPFLRSAPARPPASGDASNA